MLGDNGTKRKVVYVWMAPLRGYPQDPGCMAPLRDSDDVQGWKTGIHHVPFQLLQRRREQTYTTQSLIRTTVWLR